MSLTQQLAPLDRQQRRLRSTYQLPLIQGGQGRDASEVRADAEVVPFLIFTVVAFVIFCGSIGLGLAWLVKHN